jgi:hypothetical protein
MSLDSKSIKLLNGSNLKKTRLGDRLATMLAQESARNSELHRDLATEINYLVTQTERTIDAQAVRLDAVKAGLLYLAEVLDTANIGTDNVTTIAALLR